MRPLRLPLTIIDNRRGRVPRPSWCTYLVCNRCNARCGMCDSWKLQKGYEMSEEEVMSVFSKIGSLDVVRVTGGEPFLREDLSKVTHNILRASNPAVLHITTNGSFPDRVVDLVQAFPKPSRLHIMVSFDGLAEEHDRNRGDRVTFASARQTVEAVAALRPRLGVHVMVNHTVISQQSMRDHQGLVKTMAKIGVEVHSVLAYEDSAMYGKARRGNRASDLILGSRYPLHPALDPAEALAFVERELERIEDHGSTFTRFGKSYYLEGLRQRLAGVESPSPKPKCTALRSHIRLLPDGSVPVCQFNTEVTGNLREQSFEEVWHSPKTKTNRAWVDACPGCWAECEVLPSAIYTGDILAPRARSA